MTNNKELVVLYIVGKDDDELKQHELRLRKYCELKGYNVQEVYKDFNCKFNINKPQFQRLTKDIEQSKVQKVITCTANMITRNIDNLLIFIKPIFSGKCSFENLEDFNMFSYIGKTKTSLFTFFNGLESV